MTNNDYNKRIKELSAAIRQIQLNSSPDNQVKYLSYMHDFTIEGVTLSFCLFFNHSDDIRVSWTVINIDSDSPHYKILVNEKYIKGMRGYFCLVENICDEMDLREALIDLLTLQKLLLMGKRSLEKILSNYQLSKYEL